MYGKVIYDNESNYGRTFRTLRSLPADIFLAPHANEFGLWRKGRERATARDPADPFMDRDGYLGYIDRLGEEVPRADRGPAATPLGAASAKTRFFQEMLCDTK